MNQTRGMTQPLSAFGRSTRSFTSTPEYDKQLIAIRPTVQATVDVAFLTLLTEEMRKDFSLVPQSLLLDAYKEIRKLVNKLLPSGGHPEVVEYVVVTEFTRSIVLLTDINDPKVVEKILLTGADVLLDAKRNNISYPMRPWVALFEKFLESQKNTEWSISTSLFSVWTDPNKCQFNKSEMPLIIRAHLSGLAVRMGDLAGELGAVVMGKLISADSRVLLTSGMKQNKTELSKAKRNLISECHQVLSNISLYRKDKGLAL